MASGMKRVIVSISPDLEQGLDTVKRERFYNKTYSEVYRYILALGLKVAYTQEKAAKGSSCEKAS